MEEAVEETQEHCTSSSLPVIPRLDRIDRLVTYINHLFRSDFGRSYFYCVVNCFR